MCEEWYILSRPHNRDCYSLLPLAAVVVGKKYTRLIVRYGGTAAQYCSKNG